MDIEEPKSTFNYPSPPQKKASIKITWNQPSKKFTVKKSGEKKGEVKRMRYKINQVYLAKQKVKVIVFHF